MCLAAVQDDWREHQPLPGQRGPNVLSKSAGQDSSWPADVRY